MFIEINTIKYKIKLCENKNSPETITNLELREGLGNIIIIDLFN